MSDIITLVLHTRSNKHFVLLDENGDRFQVVNPEGGVVSLPLDFFHEDQIFGELAEIGPNEPFVLTRPTGSELTLLLAE